MPKKINNTGFFVSNFITIAHLYKMTSAEFGKLIGFTNNKKLFEITYGRHFPTEELISLTIKHTGISRKVLFECELRLTAKWEHPFENLQKEVKSPININDNLL